MIDVIKQDKKKYYQRFKKYCKILLYYLLKVLEDLEYNI